MARWFLIWRTVIPRLVIGILESREGWITQLNVEEEKGRCETIDSLLAVRSILDVWSSYLYPIYVVSLFTPQCKPDCTRLLYLQRERDLRLTQTMMKLRFKYLVNLIMFRTLSSKFCFGTLKQTCIRQQTIISRGQEHFCTLNLILVVSCQPLHDVLPGLENIVNPPEILGIEIETNQYRCIFLWPTLWPSTRNGVDYDIQILMQNGEQYVLCPSTPCIPYCTAELARASL